MADIISSSDYARLYFKKLQKLQDVVNRKGLQVYWPELKGASSWRERWIAAGFAKNIDNFTVGDFENLVRCIPEDNDSDQWQANVEDLYLKDPELFGRFSTADARWDAFLFVLKYPPKRCWDVTVLDHRITRAISVLSYITPIKDGSPIFLDRLRPLCLENHSHAESKAPWRGWYCADEKCELWRNKALELQSTIVDFAEQHVPHDAILLPEDFTGMARSRWKIYHAQPHLQSLQEMVASFNARKSEETGIRNGTSRGPKRSPTEEKWITLKFTTSPHQKQLRQILQPEKWITLKFTTAPRQKELRQILRPEKLAQPEFSARGVKLDSLITGKVRSFCPGNDAPASAVVSNTLTPTRELQLVSLQRNQSSSAVTPPSYRIQVEKPAFGTLDIHAPLPKRQRLLSASANCRSFTSQNPYQHVTDKNHSHIDRGQETHNKPARKWNTANENSSMLSVTRSPDPHYTPQEPTLTQSAASGGLQEYAEEEEIASPRRSSYDKSTTVLSRLTFQMLSPFTSVNVRAIMRQRQSVVSTLSSASSSVSGMRPHHRH